MMTDPDNSQSRRRLPSLDELLNGDDDLTEADGLADPHADGEYEAQPTSEDFASGPPADAGEYFTPSDFYGYATKDSIKRKRKTSPSSRLAGLSEAERRWASLAHTSVLLTLISGLLSGGFLSLLTLCIPLGIYFYWRNRSEYVAFQALQAFTLQAIGTVGWLALLVAGVIVGAILTVILAISLIGIPLLIVVIPALVLFILGTFAMPFAMLVYSLIAAVQTWQGVNYRLPRISAWIERQLHGGFLANM
jgi:uncharacterized Tic20 family protein